MSYADQAVLDVYTGKPTRAGAMRSRGQRQPQRRGRRVWDATMIGTFTALDAGGIPHVDFRGNPAGGPVQARTTMELSGHDVGSGVVLLFESGDPARPIIVGKILAPAKPGAGPSAVGIMRDGHRLLLSAEKEIVLACGDASITLTRAGKVLVRGKYVLTDSAGVNRIRGGTVQIN